jgi:hypothetical protein
MCQARCVASTGGAGPLSGCEACARAVTYSCSMANQLDDLMLALGRPLAAVAVGYPVAQVEGQLSGVEIAPPTGASRPSGDSWTGALKRAPNRCHNFPFAGPAAALETDLSYPWESFVAVVVPASCWPSVPDRQSRDEDEQGSGCTCLDLCAIGANGHASAVQGAFGPVKSADASRSTPPPAQAPRIPRRW